MQFKQRLALGFVRAKFKILSTISKKKAARQAFQLFCTPQSRNTKQPANVFGEAEHIQFQFEEYAIVGYRWNEGGARKALIVHGFESSVVNFDHFIPMLIKKDYEVLAFDAPAHGRSSGRRVTAIIYADLLKFVYDNYGPVDSFISHSFGGLVTCLALAEIRHDSSCRLVLIAPATETATAIEQMFQLIDLKDPGVKKEFEKIILDIGGHPVSWYSIPRSLETIHARILWIHDEDDRTTPLSDVSRLMDSRPANIQFMITRGLGHRKIYRDFAVIAKISEFV